MLLCNVLALSSRVNMLEIDAKSATSLPSGIKSCFDSQKVTQSPERRLYLMKKPTQKEIMFLYFSINMVYLKCRINSIDRNN